MKKLMFIFLLMFFVFGMYVSSAIGADCYLKWDVGQDGSFDTTATLKPGETVTVDLWVTDIPDPGASSFEVGYTGDTTVGMKYDTNVLQCTSVTVNTDDWPLFTYADWTTTPGRINAGGCAQPGVGHKGDKKLITIEFQCLSEGSETFDFTENERFYLGMLGAGSFDVDKETYALTINCGTPGPNQPPVAEDQSVKTDKNESVDITLKATDPDGNPLTYIITSLPSNGSLKEGDNEITSVPYSLSGDTVTYTPNTDYTGSDSFKFKANDGELDSNEATVSIEVGKPGPNKPPVAYDQFKYTTKDKPIDITLEAIDPDGDPLTYSIVDEPSHGTLSNFDADAGTVTYTPNTGYTGRDSFTFKASDGKEDSNEATVTIKVGEEEGYQSITPRPSRINPTPGQEFTFSVMYDASDNALTGTGFYVHYSSRYLEFLKVSNVLEEGYLLPDNPEVEDDIEDYDNDPSTDKRFVVCWADPIPPPSWPGVNLPLKLMDVTFRVKEEPLINTFINFSADKGTPIGYGFESQPLELCDVDIKANGQDGPITLSHSDTLTISLSLDNNGRTDNADFWLAVDTSFGVFFYILDEGWTDAWVPGYQGPLCYLDSYKVIRDMELLWIRAGKYTFYFGVDTVMDGEITWDKAVYDTVEVNISSE